jgi:hypothetical protein
MACTLDIDPAARAQIRELPPAGTAALAEAFEVLSLVPERGEPINADNPGGGIYQLTFGGGRGQITYQGRLGLTWVETLVRADPSEVACKSSPSPDGSTMSVRIFTNRPSSAVGSGSSTCSSSPATLEWPISQTNGRVQLDR